MNRPSFLLAVLVAAVLAAGCRTGPECHAPEIRCGDRCVDASRDPANCGGCGVTVPAGETCCGSPVDLQTDALNCGACAARCPVGGVCTGGACSCPGALPTTCGTNPGACVNLATGDGGYCGSCGVVCAGTGVAGADAICTAGACACAGTAAATDCHLTSPAVVCVNTLTDEWNCGGCNQRCPPHAVCASNGAPSPAGVCGCDAGSAWPDDCGATAGCVNLTTDPAHCGTCGQACTGTTPSCSAGHCCPAGQTWCATASACVDTRTSAVNCGSCGHACDPGLACSAGACACPSATPRSCGSACCAGTACCGGGTSCQTAHSNGLGGTFYDCTASYAPGTLDRNAALAAADSWHAGNTYDLFCSGSCVARQVTTSSSCAMWCWQGSYAGHVTSGGLACDTLCTNFIGGSTPTWP